MVKKAPVILNTRATHQAKQLTNELKKFNYKVVDYPVSQMTRSRLQLSSFRARNFDYIIFVSTNAVQFTMPRINIKNSKVIAVGPATAAAVTAYNVTQVTIPEDKYSTEGILAMPCLNSDKSNIAIFCGNHSKKKLATMLKIRGHNVSSFEVYNVRSSPPYKISNNIDTIISFSNNSLVNLCKIIKNSKQIELYKKTIVVISEDMIATAKQLGFTGKVIAAKQPSNIDVINTLLQIHNN